MRPAPFRSFSDLPIPPVSANEISTSASEPESDGEFSEMTLELHECIVWESGVTFEHRLPDAYICEGTSANC